MTLKEEPRKYIPISERTGVRIAAGLGLAAFASAKAAVVYTDIADIVSNSTQTFGIDIDGDGSNDFDFQHVSNPQGSVSYAPNYSFSAVDVIPSAGGNGAVASSYLLFNGYYNANLAAGTMIGGGDSFITYNSFSENDSRMGLSTNQYSYSFTYGGTYNLTEAGAWLGASNGYLGVVFDIGGADHFGWIEASLSADASTLTIHGFAFECDAGVGITAGDTGSGATSCNPVVGAPEPQTLGLLALGAVALAGLRRRQRKLDA